MRRGSAADAEGVGSPVRLVLQARVIQVGVALGFALLAHVVPTQAPGRVRERSAWPTVWHYELPRAPRHTSVQLADATVHGGRVAHFSAKSSAPSKNSF